MRPTDFPDEILSSIASADEKDKK